MPRNILSSRLPKYRKHGASGQALVTLNGVDHYLGPHGTKASKLEYDRLVAEWLQNGRELRGPADGSMTVAMLMAAYVRFARGYYRRGQRQTSEVDGIKYSLRPLKALYAEVAVSDFGPMSLQTVRQRMVDDGLSRGVVNQCVGRIKRMFKWGAAQELIPASIPHSLMMVAGLRKGRCGARDFDPVLPVDDATVDATLTQLPDVVADMVRFQRFTGARPDEVCGLRPCDLDRSGEVWKFRPESHKTEYTGRSRIIFIGPKGQGVLLRYLARDANAHCFQPADSEAKRRAARHAERIVPLSCGNTPGTNRKPRPKRSAGNQYTVGSYRRAIHRGCDRAFPVPDDFKSDPVKLKAWQSARRWSPNRLRHSAATEIRRKFGLEAAQVILGHAAADVTQIYAERDYALAAHVAKEIGSNHVLPRAD